MTTTKLASRGWYHAIGKATEQLHHDSFPQAIIEAFHRAFSFDFAMIIIFPYDSVPILVYEETLSDVREVKGQTQHYLDGIYLLDPLYQAAIGKQYSGFYSLKNDTPDDFYHSDFFTKHFTHTKLKDDINYLLPIEDFGTVVISIGSIRRFSESEINRFQTVESWVLSMLKKHWGFEAKQRQERPESISLHQKLTANLQNFGRSKLTDRECDVVQLILKGHSSKSAALKLSISAETIKAHRHNIYQKLDIQSQSELFALFIDAITNHHEDNLYSDPLDSYMA